MPGHTGQMTLKNPGRRTRFGPSSSLLRDKTRRHVAVRELIAAHGPRGPVAVVVRESSPISSAQMDVFGHKTECIDVFWDVDDAQQWLDERLAQAHETQSQTGTPHGR